MVHRSTTTVRLVATAAALLIAGGAVTSDGNVAPASAESEPTGRPAPANLTGTYRVDVIGSEGRFNGEPYLLADTVRWYSFTSSCNSTGCTAAATQLTDAHPASTHPRGRTFTLRLRDGRWITDPLVDASPCLADPERRVPLDVRWQLDPLPGGTLTGTRTLTEVAGGTGPCAGSGGVYETPVRLTRVPGSSH